MRETVSPSHRRPVSLAAERAVRLLRERGVPLNSRTLAEEVLSTKAPDEPTAHAILKTAFAGDDRLIYREGRWERTTADVIAVSSEAMLSDVDRVLLLLDGERPAPRRPFELRSVAAVRIQGDEVIDACGGAPTGGPAGNELREEFLRVIDRAVPVVHDPPGALAALEHWLEEPLPAPLSLRELARDRLGLRANHELALLAGRLDLQWTDSEEWQDRVSVLDACLEELRREGETIEDMRRSSSAVPPIPWSRYEFDRSFLRALPRVAGTYHFFDAEGRLTYVGKAKNLHRRVSSYFHEGRPRTARIQRLLDSLHRIEFEPLQSDLEALIQEAIDIERKKPTHNIQRQIHLKGHHRSRLRSIMILEPATQPLVFRAYLIRDGRFLEKIGIGPRGGGLRRLERVLNDHFFQITDGPAPLTGPDVDVELIARWLAEHRDRVVAFDPTTLRSADEVILRLKSLLDSRELFEPDGSPILFR